MRMIPKILRRELEQKNPTLKMLLIKISYIGHNETSKILHV